MDLGFFFDPERPVALGINVAILVAFLASLTSLLALYLRRVRPGIEDAERGLEQDYQTVEGWGNFAQTMGSGSLVRRTIKTLEVLHEQKTSIDADGLLDRTAAELRSPTEFVRWAPGGLVLLGLVGTLWGLGDAVSELTQILDSRGMTDSEAMRDAILQTLGGTKTAFSTTLAGVSGSLLLGFCLSFYKRAEDTFMVRLESLVTTRLKPMYETSESSLLGDAARRLDEVAGTLDQELNGIAKSLENEGRRIETSLRAGIESLEDTFEKRAQHLLASVTEVRDGTLEIIGERDPDAPTLAQYVRSVQQSSEGLEDSVNATRSLIPELRESLQASIRDQREGIQEALEKYVAQIEKFVERDQSAAQDLTAATVKTAREIERLEGVLGEVRESYQESREAWTKADELIETLGVELKEQVRTGLSDVLREASDLARRQADLQEAVARALEDFQDELSQTLQVLENQSKRSRRQAEEITTEMRRTLGESVEKVGVQLGEQQTHTLDRVRSALKDVVREMRDLTIGNGTENDPQRGRIPSRSSSGGRLSDSDGIQIRDEPESDSLPRPGRDDRGDGRDDIDQLFT